MDTIKEKSKRQHILDWAWRQVVANGLPQSQRDAFNKGFDIGFGIGRKKGREEANSARQTRISGT
jgi:hypothetical protein